MAKKLSYPYSFLLVVHLPLFNQSIILSDKEIVRYLKLQIQRVASSHNGFNNGINVALHVCYE